MKHNKLFGDVPGLTTYQQVLGPIVAFAAYQPAGERKAESASR